MHRKRTIVQHCKVHKQRNILAHLLERLHANFAGTLRDIGDSEWALEIRSKSVDVTLRERGLQRSSCENSTAADDQTLGTRGGMRDHQGLAGTMHRSARVLSYRGAG